MMYKSATQHCMNSTAKDSNWQAISIALVSSFSTGFTCQLAAGSPHDDPHLTLCLVLHHGLGLCSVAPVSAVQLSSALLVCGYICHILTLIQIQASYHATLSFASRTNLASAYMGADWQAKLQIG